MVEVVGVLKYRQARLGARGEVELEVLVLVIRARQTVVVAVAGLVLEIQVTGVRGW